MLLASVLFATYILVTKKGPCEVPIKYTIGTLDPRFNISKNDFIKIMESADSVWEKALNKDLFEYVPKYTPPTRFEYYFGRPAIVVNLIYDFRQQNADTHRALAMKIDDTKDSAEVIKSQFQALQNTYSIAKKEYLVELSVYNARRGDFNTLEKKRIEVNNLADEINSTIKKYNYLVGLVNTNIDKINQTAGQEFEEGQYTSNEKGERINIYEFSDASSLSRVMAHEFGHALGLNHNDNTNSIMYYLNSSRNFSLTVEDLRDLKAVCVGK